LSGATAWGQSSQATLQGQVTNQSSGEPIASALVIQRNLLTSSQGYRYTNEQGFYSFPALAPGTYSVRVDALGFQAEERAPVELPVAARMELNFALLAGPDRPPPGASSTPRLGENPKNILAIMYGADAAVPQAVLVRLPVSQVETLVGSISSLIDENKILELPLAGRDVYTLLVVQPDVSSDNATARGLGFSVNGQPAASSNFLLDGVDNNDLQVSGPAARVSADAVKEYRMGTNNFTAEFGRVSGTIANVITQSGTNQLHGTAFEFFNHDKLNANSFDNNWRGLLKEPLQLHQFGGSLGGPLRRERLFFFANFEQQRSTTESQPVWYRVPSPRLVASASEGSLARQLLSRFPPPAGMQIPTDPDSAGLNFSFPLSQRSNFAMGRADYSLPDGRRLSARYVFSQQTDEDFLAHLYEGFNASLVLRGQNVSLNYTADLHGGTNELKFGMNRNSVSLLRPHPEIPFLFSGDGIVLPGSDSGSDFFYRDTVLHLLDNFSRLSGRHALKFGLEWRPYLHDSLFSPARDGAVGFSSVYDFLADRPSLLRIAVQRESGLPAADQDFWRYYFQNESAAFFQDDWKLARRLTLNFGIRWEYFGSPEPRKGTVDYNFVFGQGRTPGERIAAGRLAAGRLFAPDRNNFAPRFGFAIDLLGSGRSVLRGGYGIFFDRIFNSFWADARSNSVALRDLVNAPGQPPQFQYTLPIRSGVPPATRINPASSVAVDQELRTPYAQGWFLGLQQELTANLLLEVNHTGAAGRKLAAADIVNRIRSLPSTPQNFEGRFNPNAPDINFRSNQGHSDHLALQVALNRRWSRGFQFQASYTYGRTRDVQSDPFGRRTGTQADRRSSLSDTSFFTSVASFARQLDPNADYSHSDFDQNHNLVFNFIAQTPYVPGSTRLFSGWQVAALAGFRSGFPFSVISGAPGTVPPGEIPFYVEPGSGLLRFNRADYWGENAGEAFLDNPSEIPGGLVLLDAERFEKPAYNRLGNMPRNAFRGPGFWNVDFSLSRSFPMSRLGEGASVQFRMEFFNLFNHTNLNNPENLLESPTFGQASYGRQGVGSSQPSAAPLNEKPRRVQLALKLYF
jgi:hypothetical protein